MADGGNRFPRVLSVLAIVIFKGVTCNIDDGSIDDGNNFDGFEVPCRRFHVCNISQ